MRTAEHAFGVYLHIPYCRRICPYCDFNVHIARRADWNGLRHGILSELAARAPQFGEPVIASIYFGGGTPSLAPPELLADLLARLRQDWQIADDAEITIEIDPATLARDGFARLRRLGVTRVSLGWQSTHDRLLRLLGRGHSAADSRDAYTFAREAGFENVSLDLIFAVPGQTANDLDADLDAILAIRPDHVSLYALTYHEGTELYRRRARGRLVPVSEDLEAEMMMRVAARLTAAGFEHYEVSNYARAGKRSRHNQIYWHGGQYLGAGPGAHSFAREGWRAGWRWEGVRSPADFARLWAAPRGRGRPPPGDPTVSFVEELDMHQLLSERFLLGLRTADGVDLESLAGSGDGARLEVAAEVAQRRGWLRREGGHLLPSPAGLMNADALAELFF